MARAHRPSTKRAPSHDRQRPKARAQRKPGPVSRKPPASTAGTKPPGIGWRLRVPAKPTGKHTIPILVRAPAESPGFQMEPKHDAAAIAAVEKRAARLQRDLRTAKKRAAAAEAKLAVDEAVIAGITKRLHETAALDLSEPIVPAVEQALLWLTTLNQTIALACGRLQRDLGLPDPCKPTTGNMLGMLQSALEDRSSANATIARLAHDLSRGEEQERIEAASPREQRQRLEEEAGRLIELSLLLEMNRLSVGEVLELARRRQHHLDLDVCARLATAALKLAQEHRGSPEILRAEISAGSFGELAPVAQRMAELMEFNFKLEPLIKAVRELQAHDPERKWLTTELQANIALSGLRWYQHLADVYDAIDGVRDAHEGVALGGKAVESVDDAPIDIGQFRANPAPPSNEPCPTQGCNNSFDGNSPTGQCHDCVSLACGPAVSDVVLAICEARGVFDMHTGKCEDLDGSGACFGCGAWMDDKPTIVIVAQQALVDMLLKAANMLEDGTETSLLNALQEATGEWEEFDALVAACSRHGMGASLMAWARGRSLEAIIATLRATAKAESNAQPNG